MASITVTSITSNTTAIVLNNSNATIVLNVGAITSTGTAISLMSGMLNATATRLSGNQTVNISGGLLVLRCNIVNGTSDVIQSTGTSRAYISVIQFQNTTNNSLHTDDTSVVQLECSICGSILVESGSTLVANITRSNCTNVNNLVIQGNCLVSMNVTSMKTPGFPALYDNNNGTTSVTGIELGSMIFTGLAICFILSQKIEPTSAGPTIDVSNALVLINAQTITGNPGAPSILCATNSFVVGNCGGIGGFAMNDPTAIANINVTNSIADINITGALLVTINAWGVFSNFTTHHIVSNCSESHIYIGAMNGNGGFIYTTSGNHFLTVERGNTSNAAITANLLDNASITVSGQYYTTGVPCVVVSNGSTAPDNFNILFKDCYLGSSTNTAMTITTTSVCTMILSMNDTFFAASGEAITVNNSNGSTVYINTFGCDTSAPADVTGTFTQKRTPITVSGIDPYEFSNI